MLLFWIICGLMTLLALWFVLPPLFAHAEDRKNDEMRAANVLVYQDQCQELETDLRNGLIGEPEYPKEKEALERRLLADTETAKREASASPGTSPATRKVAYAVAAAIPIVAIAFYLVRGNPRGLNPETAPSTMPGGETQAGEMTPQQIEANVGKLAKRLEENPNDAQGWVMLGRSYTMMERYADAATAYGRATTLNGGDANLWTDYAEALALSNGQRLEGKPMEAVNRALQIDPNNEKALALAGEAAYQAADYRKAIEYWQKLRPGSETGKAVSDQLAKAKELAAGRGSR
ncbi:MAG TPA: c-type cytochrome biogenesis protein CcmI [Pyrinomonadaceae bacterium]|nr:c-type cytochrome biogenesis protein CcmI [Pyrinomonadaceae bacterium]